ncbi:UNVERIFIED_CONTAM: hypothetical protein Sindi_2898900, partial [Sesamum indicum]
VIITIVGGPPKPVRGTPAKNPTVEERGDRPIVVASTSPAAGSSSPTNQTPPAHVQTPPMNTALPDGKAESLAIVLAPENSAAKADVMHDVMGRADVMHDVMGDITVVVKDDITILNAGNDNITSLNAGIDDVENKIIHDVANFNSINSHVNATPTGLFIGKIPLHANTTMIVDDKITQAFNNSSRKILSYIAPTTQNGEVVVRPTLETVRDGARQ